MLARMVTTFSLVLTLCTAATAQQKYPSRNIDLIIPFAVGGGVDLIARAMGASLSEQLGQTVVAVNRDGAAGTLGFTQLAGAAPDGHTISLQPFHADRQCAVSGQRRALHRRFVRIHLPGVRERLLHRGRPELEIQDREGSARAAKGKPEVSPSGTPASASIPHLSGENLADALKFKVQHLPFRGDGVMLPVLIKGDIDFGVGGISSIRGNDTIRPLLMFSDKRHPAYPDVPTAKELGVTTSVPPGHNGVFAPKGLPAEVKSALERGCANAVKSETVLRVTGNTGQAIVYLDSAQFEAQTRADYKFKGELIKRLGLATP